MSGTRQASVEDEKFVRALELLPGLETSAGAAWAWWQAEALEDEAFSAFLTRQSLVSPAQTRAIRMLAQGYVGLAETVSMTGDLDLASALSWQQNLGPSKSSSFSSWDDFQQSFGSDAPETIADESQPTITDSADLNKPNETPKSAQIENQNENSVDELVHDVPAPKSSGTGPLLTDTQWSSAPTEQTMMQPSAGQSEPGQQTPLRLSDLRPGMMLGKCRLESLIGEGGYGCVYKGLNEHLEIPVAVKVLKLGKGRRQAQLDQFRDEARLLARVNHPNVVRLWDYDVESGLPYMVQEYVSGLSLLDLLGQCGRLSVERAIQVIKQSAEGLRAAHQMGVVHRDVKPANLLLTREGQVKVADLGLALLNPGENSDAPAGKREVAGTVDYMAPEQADGRGPDCRSDLYSLGISFYQCLTGKLPFSGRTWMEVMVKHATEPLQPPTGLAEPIPQPVWQVISGLCAKDPAQRPANYDDFLAQLQELELMAASMPQPMVRASSGQDGWQPRSSRPMGFLSRLFRGD